jgi:hypothetical protein
LIFFQDESSSENSSTQDSSFAESTSESGSTHEARTISLVTPRGDLEQYLQETEYSFGQPIKKLLGKTKEVVKGTVRLVIDDSKTEETLRSRLLEVAEAEDELSTELELEERNKQLVKQETQSIAKMLKTHIDISKTLKSQIQKAQQRRHDTALELSRKIGAGIPAQFDETLFLQEDKLDPNFWLFLRNAVCVILVILVLRNL